MRGMVLGSAAGIVMLSAFPALAGEGEFYGRVGGGLSYGGEIEQDFDHDPSIEFLIPPPTGQSIEPGLGVTLNAAIGYGLGDGFRAEGEYRFAHHSVDEVESQGVENDYTRSVDDSVSVNAVFANVLYDFGSGYSVTPYVGAGVGLAQVSSIEDDDDTTIAYQAKAGVLYPLAENTGLSVEVSYMRTGELELGPQSFSASNSQIISDGGNYSSTSLTVSYNFGF